MSFLTPAEVVTELGRHIIGQEDAKKAVAIALRNRWRRQQLDDILKEEVRPKNILMIGPTGVGKTEVARRLAKLVKAPFLKVEATKFTEVGYVGRDVEQIIRDLVEISINITKQEYHKEVESKAQKEVFEKIIHGLEREGHTYDNIEKLETKITNGELDHLEIEISVEDNSNPFSAIEIPGMPGAQIGMMNIGDMLGKSFNKKKKRRRLSIQDAKKILKNEECEKLLDQDKVIQEAITLVEQNGIVFIDEFDKICAKSSRGGNADVSREGVQRDLLPLIEGTTVQTKYGPIQTTHILFIASGAFHISRPSDLLPEIQGRLPIRVELQALTAKHFIQILTEPESSLIKQYKALMLTEGVNLDFTTDGVNEIAYLAFEMNQNVENIGARRLHTVLEKILEVISFEANKNEGKTITINKQYVIDKVEYLAKSSDLSKFIL